MSRHTGTRPELNFGLGTKLPMVLQTEAAECGLACIAMIGAYYGNHTELGELRRRFGLSTKGATLHDLIRITDALGMASRPLQLDVDEMRELKLPCIVHWDLNHFVVLARLERNSVVIHDPASGTARLSLAEFSKHFTGIALELTPTSEFSQAAPPPRLKLGSLMGRVVGLKRSLGLVFAMALAIEVFAIANPFFMQWVVDHALVTADKTLLVTLVLGFLLLLLVQTGVSTLRGWVIMVLSASLKVQGRANLFTHLIRLPAAYFESRYLGDVMSRFESQEKIQHAVTTDLVEAMLDGIMASITLVVMFVYSPLLAAVVLGGATLYALLRWASYRPLRDTTSEEIVWAAKRDSHFLETLRGIRSIQLLGGQNIRRTRWMNLLVETINRELNIDKLKLGFRNVHSLVDGALGLGVVWLGALQVLDNTFSVGMLLAFVSYKDQFLKRIGALIDKGVDLAMLRLHADRLADIVLTAPEPRDQTPEVGRVRPSGAIELRNVRFRYSDNDPWVLDGVNLCIEPGESVAIIGPSGCGKTTLMKILSSLQRPTSGEMLVGGETINRIGTSQYRKMIGVVLQDDQLFAGSLADNICFFADRPDLARVEKCARMAAVHDDISAMPMGYGTLIGDMGTVLSGGQKQRVLIARALYRKPRILLLDEATSHLDIDREKAVNEAVQRLRMTRIIIAHRPETIRSADRVIVLENGRVAKDIRVGEPRTLLPGLGSRPGSGEAVLAPAPVLRKPADRQPAADVTAHRGAALAPQDPAAARAARRAAQRATRGGIKVSLGPAPELVGGLLNAGSNGAVTGPRR